MTSLHSIRARLAALAARVPVPPNELPILGPFDLVDWDNQSGRLVHTSTAIFDRQSRTWREVPPNTETQNERT